MEQTALSNVSSDWMCTSQITANAAIVRTQRWRDPDHRTSLAFNGTSCLWLNLRGRWHLSVGTWRYGMYWKSPYAFLEKVGSMPGW